MKIEDYEKLRVGDCVVRTRGSLYPVGTVATILTTGLGNCVIVNTDSGLMGVWNVENFDLLNEN